MVLITGITVFVLWIVGSRIAHKGFVIIKRSINSEYKNILGGKKESWLERGSRSPVDIGIQLRLYRYLFGNEEEVLHPINKKFTRIVKIFIAFLVTYFLSVALFIKFNILNN